MNDSHQYVVAGFIFFSLTVVAGVIFFSQPAPGNRAQNNQVGEGAALPAQATATTDAVNPVTAADHRKGRVDAPITLVTYTDFECPFCQRFHTTMNQVMERYGDEGDVAWVFRQFPVEQLHSKASAVALASECVAKLAGNVAFWQFADRYFEVSPSNNRTDIETVIPQLVTEIGINQEEFQSCMDSGESVAAVEEDLNNAVSTGGRGTPWSILIAPNGKTFPVSGAQPPSAIEQLIEIARNEI